MDIIHAIILGTLQGITEWLPISSSAHLVLFQKYVVCETSVFLDALAHLGTLLSVLVLYGRDFFKILKDLFFGGEKRDYAFKLIVASLPIVIIGLLFASLIENAFENPSNIMVGGALLLTAAFLFATKFAKVNRDEVKYSDSLIIGLAQALAILPGVSRSGLTISTGNILGISRKSAMLFSFYMAIIAIVGANALEFFRTDFSNIDLAAGIAVFLSSFLVGIAALILLRKIILREKFHLFGIYCLILGIILILF